MKILETKDLRKIYGAGENQVHALDGVSFTVEKGEFVAVVGTSGSGKSTLLNMIGGLDRPTSGSVMIRGRNLLDMKEEDLTMFRRRNIGFIFQNYNLIPVLNVYENIVLPVGLDGGKVDEDFLKEVIKVLSLEEKLNDLPGNLSGYRSILCSRTGNVPARKAWLPNRTTRRSGLSPGTSVVRWEKPV